MASVNKVILIGNLGQAPDVRVTNTGMKVAEISIATTRRFTRNDERVEQTQWHTVTLWGKLAEIVEKYNGRIKTAKPVTQQKSSPRASSSWINEPDS